MENKEVIFVSNFFGDGGAARVISVLAESLAEQGYKVTICSYPFKNREEYRHSDKVSYIRFDMVHQNGVLYKIERITKLRKELKRHKGAVVISFEYFMNMQTIVAMIGLKNKLIISERNDPKRVGGSTPTRQLRNLLYRFADCLVCQTQEALEYFPKNIQKKSVVILNPIKDNLPRRWIGERRKNIVNFCRLEKQKNLPLLIDSFKDWILEMISLISALMVSTFSFDTCSNSFPAITAFKTLQITLRDKSAFTPKLEHIVWSYLFFLAAHL